MTKNVLNNSDSFVSLCGGRGISSNFCIERIRSVAGSGCPSRARQRSAPSAEVERVVVTGSNIPTAEETGPNPVDTYRPQDIEKLGIRNATDLQPFIPQEAGGTVNQNIGNGGDGTVQFNLRGLLPKETLILIDGKRIAMVHWALPDSAVATTFS